MYIIPTSKLTNFAYKNKKAGQMFSLDLYLR